MSESKLYRRKRSNIWLHFTPELNGGKARCGICKALLAFTGGMTSNLDGHVSERKYWEMLTTVALRHET